MDTIDVSNLNRQFLFRPSDVGKSKAECAAAFINKRVKTAKVVAHNCPIEEIENEIPGFYEDFQLVVCGLDSVVARRWINDKLHALIERDENGEVESNIPLIDGGTEAFKGSARVILPGKTACIDCTLDLFPPQVHFPMCTIATRPRLPEHCIAWAKQVLWPKPAGEGGREGDDLDGDDPEHIKWLFEKASERAAEYSIAGVTYRLTQGVVKNIIPAVASTNAVIAAACANEALKLMTGCAPVMNNYMMFNDGEGVYNMVVEQERKEDCSVCSGKPVPYHDCTLTSTLQDFFTALKEDPKHQMKDPSAMTVDAAGKNKTLYVNSAALHKATEKHLSMTFEELGVVSGQEISVTDCKRSPVRFTMLFESSFLA